MDTRKESSEQENDDLPVKLPLTSPTLRRQNAYSDYMKIFIDTNGKILIGTHTPEANKDLIEIKNAFIPATSYMAALQQRMSIAEQKEDVSRFNLFSKNEHSDQSKNSFEKLNVFVNLKGEGEVSLSTYTAMKDCIRINGAHVLTTEYLDAKKRSSHLNNSIKLGYL